jgi:integrase
MESRPKNLLEQVREAIQLKRYSYRTEESYVQWIRRYILFHNKRHPREMGSVESGLRLREGLQLRIKDMDFAQRQIVVQDAKGKESRVTMLPGSLVESLKQHLQRVRRLHQRDLDAEYGSVICRLL